MPTTHSGTIFGTSRRLIESCSSFEPFADTASSRSRLEAVQRRNLELYGYGAKGYTLSAIETAIELAGDNLSIDAIRAILAAGRTLLSHPVDLLAGVSAALDAPSARAPLVLVTKGDLLHQEAKIAASGVGDLFCDVQVVIDKTEVTFRRIRADAECDVHCLVAGHPLVADL